MTTCDANTPIGLLAILHPGAVRVLQALGVDLALENDRPLEEACAMRDLPADDVLERIRSAERGAADAAADWETLRAALPRSYSLPPGAVMAPC